ncbi:hypothetical protein M407DRAFT_106589 [Tulasnella calospora MUT 4182]|uniref:Uncharacterized protein n=1 Tax=Tulasnella calospora MUT 4182 TaxID=1051891 RepID=A0A0C3Q4L1_9AGAM|nr:hypothetical protein M407DRAFT_106589 [Tulasnella calospora MUT 4182]
MHDNIGLYRGSLTRTPCAESRIPNLQIARQNRAPNDSPRLCLSRADVGGRLGHDGMYVAIRTGFVTCRNILKGKGRVG